MSGTFLYMNFIVSWDRASVSRAGFKPSFYVVMTLNFRPFFSHSPPWLWQSSSFLAALYGAGNWTQGFMPAGNALYQCPTPQAVIYDFFKRINSNGKSLFFLDEVFNPFGQLAAVIN